MAQVSLMSLAPLIHQREDILQGFSKCSEARTPLLAAPGGARCGLPSRFKHYLCMGIIDASTVQVVTKE